MTSFIETLAFIKTFFCTSKEFHKRHPFFVNVINLLIRTDDKILIRFYNDYWYLLLDSELRASKLKKFKNLIVKLS